MPYKDSTSYHRHLREWLKTLRPEEDKLPENLNGVLRRRTVNKYRGYMTEAGEILGFPDPSNVSLEQMRSLECELYGEQATISQKCVMVRRFLQWCGNKDAFKWRISVHQSVYKGGIFLKEPKVAKVRMTAHDIGLMTELVYSLGVDNGLRACDMCWLTVENAREFLDVGESEILGKGRNGGKIDLQTLNRMTSPLIKQWLQVREGLVREAGADIPNLLCRVVHYRKKVYLAPMEWINIDGLMEELSYQSGVLFKTHDLRRTCGNRLWRKDVPIETIAMLLRHKDCGVTFRAYIGVQSDDMREAMDLLAEPMPVLSSGMRNRVPQG